MRVARMDLAFNLMNSAFKMMNSVLNTMDFANAAACGEHPPGRRSCLARAAGTGMRESRHILTSHSHVTFSRHILTSHSHVTFSLSQLGRVFAARSGLILGLTLFSVFSIEESSLPNQESSFYNTTQGRLQLYAKDDHHFICLYIHAGD